MNQQSLLPLAALLLACSGSAAPSTANPAPAPPPAEPEVVPLPDGLVPMALHDGVLLARKGLELSWWRMGERTGNVLLREIDWMRARVATSASEAWIATWAAAADGPLTLRHITADGETRSVPAVQAADCPADHTACDVSIRAIELGAEGPWLGGWLGVHSNEVAFRGLVVHPATERSWALDGPVADGRAFETTVDAILPVQDGVWVVGHHQDPATHPSGREGLWWARIDAAGTVTGPTALPGSDPLWSGAAPALAATPQGLRIALAGDDSVRMMVLDAKGVVTSDELLALPHPGRAVWLDLTPEGHVGLSTRGILHRLAGGRLDTWVTPDDGFLSVVGWHERSLMAAGRRGESFVLRWPAAEE